MNQVIQMFNESNKRLNMIMRGNYDRSQLEDAYREFNGQVKLLNAVVQAFAVSSKNKRAMKSFESMNLMDDNTAISLGLPGDDMIKCPDKNRLIKREDCLDYSGSNEECQECEHFKTSRKLMLEGEQSWQCG